METFALNQDFLKMERIKLNFNQIERHCHVLSVLKDIKYCGARNVYHEADYETELLTVHCNIEDYDTFMLKLSKTYYGEFCSQLEILNNNAKN